MCPLGNSQGLSLPLLLMGSLIAELYRVGTSSSGKDTLSEERMTT